MSIRGIAAGLIVCLALQTPLSIHAQDDLSKVRELYLSADYEGALAALDRLGDEARGRTDFSDYRVLCLLALDRSDAAREAIKSAVEADPFHHLPEEQASPKLRTAFEETRKALLPGVVQKMYAEAKAAFDRRDASAARQFEQLIALLDDPALADARLSDLRAVAKGFRDLSAEAVRPAAPAGAVAAKPPAASDETKQPVTPIAPAEIGTVKEPDAAPASSSESSAAVKEPDTAFGGNNKVDAPHAGPLTGPPDVVRVTSRGATPLITPKAPPPPGVEPPVPISQPFPQWSPRRSAAAQDYHGLLEVTIDEQGSVTAVALQQAMQPAFDQALLKAARSWKYKPALLNGTPIPFVKVIQIQILGDRQ